MWQLQTNDGSTVVTGTGPVVYSTDRGGWETSETVYADPDRDLQLVDMPAAIAAAVARIDADVDAIYGSAIGLRQAEYEMAERQAQTFADAGYEPPVPGMVQSWAIAKGWTAQAAADDVLAVAAQWRGAQELIRAQRLLRKEQARAALGPAGLAATMATWAGFVAAVRAQLGIGGA
ncbi:hypothetical protein LJR118_002882 [Acidovorax sp. LjRoot118]|uniref:hypothetical protein n=1 Tax=Acidovorax sp. LjRoot118 TaxID=3342256 RepID=UPI003ECD2DF7